MSERPGHRISSLSAPQRVRWAILLLVLCTACGPSRERPTPHPGPILKSALDSATFQRLKSRVDGEPVIRARTDWGTLQLEDPALTDAGLSYASADVLTSPATREPAMPLPLSEIREIRVRTPQPGRAAVVGALGGALVGAIIVGLAIDLSDPGFSNVLRGAALGFAPGLVVGAVASPYHGWEPLYAVPEPSTAKKDRRPD